MARNRNNDDRPVGSIGIFGEADPNAIYGRGGNVRHGADLSQDNPYRKQLLYATNNKDIDALYAQAVEWEADRANTLENREYARSVLEEQREYEDPTNQLARQRAAGLNPDLAGSSGGSGGISSGSTAQEQQQPIADQQANVKYSNVYDNTAMVFNGINAASSMISSLTQAGTAIVSGIAQMKKLPSDIALSESQAGLMDAQASEINKMLPIKQGLGIAQTGLAATQSVMNRLSMFSQLKSLASPEATDDDLTNLLGAIGVGVDDIAPIVKGYRTYEKSPELQAYQAQVEDNRRANTARNDVYTTELYGRMASLGAEMSIASDEANLRISNMKNSLLKYLADNGYVENVGKSTVTNSSTAVQSADYNKIKVEQDIKAFKQGLVEIQTAIDKSVALCDKIRKKYKYKDIFGREVNRPISGHDQSILDVEFARQAKLRTLGSAYVTNAYAELTSIAKNTSLTDLVMINGVLPTNRQMNRHGLFMQWTFDDLLDGSVGVDELTETISSQIPILGDFLSFL